LAEQITAVFSTGWPDSNRHLKVRDDRARASHADCQLHPVDEAGCRPFVFAVNLIAWSGAEWAASIITASPDATAQFYKTGNLFFVVVECPCDESRALCRGQLSGWHYSLRDGLRLMWLFRNTGFILLVPLSVVVFGLLYAVFVVWFGLIWLDGVQPPVFGWLLYPIELILNGLAFPHVTTRVHGNGAALFFLICVGGFVYVIYRLGRFAFRVGCAFMNYVAGVAAMTGGPHLPAAAVALCLGLTGTASAQSYTPDPGAWRPVAYSDLMFPTGEAESYASIWQDRLNESDQNSPPKVANGQSLNMSIAEGNRGATEWHFTINFQSKACRADCPQYAEHLH
jgi:hypothetical protein